MKIKHYIITRFLCRPIGMSEEEIKSDSIINYRLDTLKNNMIMSLKNQSNKEFEIAILLNPSLEENKIESIKEKCKDIIDKKIHFLKYNELSRFVQDNYKDCDRLILTRMDDDDFCHKNCVQDTQEVAKNVNNVCVYGYTLGYTFINQKNELYEFEHDYNLKGHLAIFQSVIINTNNIEYKKYFNPYNFSHTEVNKYIELLKNNNVLCQIIHNRDNRYFIYFRHNHTSSLKDYKLPGFCRVRSLNFEDYRSSLKENFNLVVT